MLLLCLHVWKVYSANAFKCCNLYLLFLSAIMMHGHFTNVCTHRHQQHVKAMML